MPIPSTTVTGIKLELSNSLVQTIQIHGKGIISSNNTNLTLFFKFYL
jgi:hypothetical protein